MAVRQVPVALWCSDPEENRGYTVVCLQEPELVVHAQERRAALEEMRLLLRYQQEQLDFSPDLEDASLLLVRVPVRAEQKVDKKAFALPQTYDLRVPCALGRLSSGLRSCTVPHLALIFHFEDTARGTSEGSVRDLVVHYVQQQLVGLSPAALTRLFPPTAVELDQVALKTLPQPGGRPTVELPHLEGAAEPLARSGLRCYGRDALIAEVVARLQRGASLLLVGEHGVGKTALLAEAARDLQKSEERRGLPDGLWMTGAGRLVAGMRYLGQWQERLEAVIAELEQARGVLAVESLLELVRQGGQGPSSSLAAFLAPYVERGDLQLVGEVTPTELVACQQLLPGLLDTMQTLPVPVLSPAEALPVLDQILDVLAQRKRWRFYTGAGVALLQLFSRFLPYSAFPGNVVAFLKQLATRTAELDQTALVAAFSLYTGVPERFLRDDALLDPDELMLELEERLLGQSAACRAACRIVTAFKAGLQDPTRPLGVLLLCGPTGVGKTEMAKTLASVLFGNEDRLIRLDMSEYAGPDAGERLLGTLASAQSGELVRRLRKQPFSVVLLDEVEKGDPEVFDVLLRAFDEGILTDPWGRETNLRSSIILLTSNLGVDGQRDLGLTRHAAPGYESAALTFFRPELVNRLDGVVTFEPLSQATIERIARRELQALAQRSGLRRRSISLDPSPGLIVELVARGFDARLGARPLQRAVERLVVRPLAAHLGQSPNAANQRWRLDWNGELTIRVM